MPRRAQSFTHVLVEPGQGDVPPYVHRTHTDRAARWTHGGKSTRPGKERQSVVSIGFQFPCPSEI